MPPPTGIPAGAGTGHGLGKLGQRALVDELATDGHDTAVAEALLTTLLQALDGMRAHRATILAEVATERGKAAAS